MQKGGELIPDALVEAWHKCFRRQLRPIHWQRVLDPAIVIKDILNNVLISSLQKLPRERPKQVHNLPQVFLELVMAVWRDRSAEHANRPEEFEHDAPEVPPVGARVPWRLDQDFGRSEGYGLDRLAEMSVFPAGDAPVSEGDIKFSDARTVGFVEVIAA